MPSGSNSALPRELSDSVSDPSSESETPEVDEEEIHEIVRKLFESVDEWLPGQGNIPADQIRKEQEMFKIMREYTKRQIFMRIPRVREEISPSRLVYHIPAVPKCSNQISTSEICGCE